MTEAFSINEIIELGIQIEFNGRDFYQTLAESEKDEKIRELFLFLKDEEVKHIRFFEKLLEASEDYRSDSYPEEYFSYMNALAGEHVFTQKDKGKEIAGKIKTAIEAIDMAIKALHKGTEGKLNPEATEIGVVDKNIKFHILPPDKTKEYVAKAVGGS